jgi:hypothetical protein
MYTTHHGAGRLPALIELKGGVGGAAAYLAAWPQGACARRIWWQKRALRIEAHARRIADAVRAMEAQCGENARRRGRRCAVWCVQQRRRYDSLTAAAQSMGCSPNSIARAIARGGRCGGCQWEVFIPRPQNALRPNIEPRRGPGDRSQR